MSRPTDECDAVLVSKMADVSLDRDAEGAPAGFVRGAVRSALGWIGSFLPTSWSAAQDGAVRGQQIDGPDDGDRVFVASVTDDDEGLGEEEDAESVDRFGEELQDPDMADHHLVLLSATGTSNVYHLPGTKCAGAFVSVERGAIRGTSQVYYPCEACTMTGRWATAKAASREERTPPQPTPGGTAAPTYYVRARHGAQSARYHLAATPCTLERQALPIVSLHELGASTKMCEDCARYADAIMNARVPLPSPSFTRGEHDAAVDAIMAELCAYPGIRAGDDRAVVVEDAEEAAGCGPCDSVEEHVKIAERGLVYHRVDTCCLGAFTTVDKATVVHIRRPCAHCCQYAK